MRPRRQQVMGRARVGPVAPQRYGPHPPAPRHHPRQRLRKLDLAALAGREPRDLVQHVGLKGKDPAGRQVAQRFGGLLVQPGEPAFPHRRHPVGAGVGHLFDGEHRVGPVERREQRRERVGEEVVSQVHHARLAPEKVTGGERRVPGAARLMLVQKGQRAFLAGGLAQLGLVGGAGHHRDLAHPRRPQRPHPPRQQGHPRDGQRRLGPPRTQGQQAATAPGGQNHGFHKGAASLAGLL